MIKIYNMDVMKALKQMPDESVDMQITSPPYWGLRDYGIGKDQIGLESNFEDYVKRLCDIFDEVKRVLKKDGTCWVNLGDTYSGGIAHSDWNVREDYPEEQKTGGFHSKLKKEKWNGMKKNQLQPKCLCAIPERFMIEMINRGWILRNKIIWHKPNHMPTSVKDRFANSWEYLFMFSKSKKYYFDLDTVREPHKEISIKRMDVGFDEKQAFNYKQRGLKSGNPNTGQQQFHSQNINYSPKGKNPDDVIQEDGWALILKEKAIGGAQREAYLKYLEWKKKNPNKTYEDFYNEFSSKKVSKYQDEKWQGIDEKQTAWGRYGSFLSLPNPKGIVPQDFWDITTKGYPEAHFAVFPEALVERPIKTTPKWICKKCGKARERIMERTVPRMGIDLPVSNPTKIEEANKLSKNSALRIKGGDNYVRWKQENPDKMLGWTDCKCGVGFHPAVIMDIFVGSGTTLKVARDLQRDSIGIEIKKEYCNLIRKRLFGGNQSLINDFEIIK